ncbi:MAG TPA: LpxD N-terminal domain-containing protein, partial [Verrucomicrobiota bacterium]|nr:LpxD N-terminal domain-containing protein [Verrucomicrobiota bacterium]
MSSKPSAAFDRNVGPTANPPQKPPLMPFTAIEIAQFLGGRVIGDPNVVLTGFAPADTAQTGDLTFAENHTYFARADNSAASAILVDGDFTSKTKVLIRVSDARLAFAKVLPLFFPEPAVAPGAHPTAVIAATADVDSTAYIGPFCVIGERVRIGPGCVLDAMVFVGDECKLGEKVRLFPQVTLY